MSNIETIMREIVDIQYKSKQFMDVLASNGELPPSQIILLIKLKTSGGLKAAEIASFAGVTPGAVTSMCDKLEKTGLITRVRDTTDRRVVRMQLTSEGDRYVQKTFAKYPPHQLKELATILHEVNQLMNKIVSKSS